ncbi:hypothetical protein MB901379_00124 [Mycobacterium basiliense]|uniref:Uncharacterized protein n=1 Tax=Mycobacterium basiliense TaxID=2094119 RepID=A0A447G7Z7_9MYCO|nr:hypothetical protein MB901379_00124 [Mycobacterium basiliense]
MNSIDAPRAPYGFAENFLEIDSGRRKYSSIVRRIIHGFIGNQADSTGSSTGRRTNFPGHWVPVAFRSERQGLQKFTPEGR